MISPRKSIVRRSRRAVLRLAAGGLALPVLARRAHALDYPARPVRLISGFAAGGPTDVAARVISQWLSTRLGQPFIVEARPGAASNLAADYVAHAPPDGYTLLMIGAPVAINASLYSNLKFSVVDDLVPVAGITRGLEVMVVHPSVPARTVPEFIAYAKANPGKINMASGGTGSVPDVAGRLFCFMAGIDVTSVHYRGGGPALIDLIAGQVQVLFESTLITVPQIEAGKARALAVTSTTRSPRLPDVPTVGEFVPGYETTAWYGLAAPKGTPAEVVERLNRQVNAALADPGIQQKIADLGGTPMLMTSAEFGKLIADETDRWSKLVRKFDMKPE
jgi:tripartite-type tricarboxylate transporter receptor subunit TctC